MDKEKAMSIATEYAKRVYRCNKTMPTNTELSNYLSNTISDTSLINKIIAIFNKDASMLERIVKAEVTAIKKLRKNQHRF